MFFKKSFQLLVATGTTPFFTVVSIIFAHDCNTLSVLIFARTNFRAFAQKSEKCAKISTVISRKGGMREN